VNLPVDTYALQLRSALVFDELVSLPKRGTGCAWTDTRGTRRVGAREPHSRRSASAETSGTRGRHGKEGSREPASCTSEPGLRFDGKSLNDGALLRCLTVRFVRCGT